MVAQPFPDRQGAVLGDDDLGDLQRLEGTDLGYQGIELECFTVIVERHRSGFPTDSVPHLCVGTAIAAGADSDAHNRILAVIVARGCGPGAPFRFLYPLTCGFLVELRGLEPD